MYTEQQLLQIMSASGSQLSVMLAMQWTSYSPRIARIRILSNACEARSKWYVNLEIRNDALQRRLLVPNASSLISDESNLQHAVGDTIEIVTKRNCNVLNCEPRIKCMFVRIVAIVDKSKMGN